MSLDSAKTTRISFPHACHAARINTYTLFAMTIDWSAFTPGSAIIGGVVIGLAAALFVLVNGRVAGISGIVGGMLHPRSGDLAWRLAFIAGLLLAPLACATVGVQPSATIDASYPVLIVAGLLVGIGTRYAGGCTSGREPEKVAIFAPASRRAAGKRAIAQKIISGAGR